MTDPAMKSLDAALAEAAALQPAVPHNLMAAILRDADTMQPASVAVRQGIGAILLDLIGGWPAVGGLVAAGVAGIWIGVAPPVGLESAAANLFGTTQTVDLFGSDPLGVFALEGDS